MNTRHMILMACLLLAGQAFAAAAPAGGAPAAALSAGDAPASDDSIRELLVITNAHELIDSTKAQVLAMVRASSQQALQGKAITPEKQAAMERMQAKMESVLDETLSWDSLQALYLRTYRASFTQGELDGIIAFYKTSAGQAMIKKLPLVMKNVMTEMQGMMGPMQVKIQQIQRETLQELKDSPAK